MLFKSAFFKTKLIAIAGFAILTPLGFSVKSFAAPAFKIDGKVVSVEEIEKEDAAGFYELEKRRYGMVEQAAQERYLQSFWQKEAKKRNTSVEAARKAYMEANVKISDQDVQSTIERYKESPELKGKPLAEQQARIRDELRSYESQMLEQKIIRDGMSSGALAMLLKKPVEPRLKIDVSDTDFVRYGPGVDDVKPAGCDGAACPITVVEYSEFECPFCSKVMPSVSRLLTEYKGKIRWIMRDFPLSFHKRARPAAVAAKCAGEQGKFWAMYKILYDNQSKLQDADLTNHAKAIGLDMTKFSSCQSNPAKYEAAIDAHIATGSKFGVRGTPAFFINGRLLSGAMPYEEFKRVFEEELVVNNKKK